MERKQQIMEKKYKQNIYYNNIILLHKKMFFNLLELLLPYSLKKLLYS